ncbi:hypothetical protein QZH41_006382 [Actinostola sp. cb2023]|nr:hypothetical protein QZH41_006382 [Actinostola sp. cb2023]
MAGISSKTTNKHHALSVAFSARQERHIEDLTSTIRSFTNPFTEESDDLFNLVTKVVMPEKAKHDVCNQGQIGLKLFEAFVGDRIQSNKVNVWAPMKKNKLTTWKSTSKEVKIKAGETVYELKEDRSLFARMMLACKSRPEINIKEAVGCYEFSVVPRSMFAADGTMIHCAQKSVLMSILEKCVKQDIPSNNCAISRITCITDESVDMQEHVVGGQQLRVDIVDAMAEVQSLDKPEWIKNCSQLAEYFTGRMLDKYNESDEICLIFDRYDVPSSLKMATRVRRQGGQQPIAYHITETTNIAKVPMKKLLAHVNTKMELTTYLAKKTLEIIEAMGKHVVLAWSNKCQATHRKMSHLQSDQEEADTKMLLHALDATTSGATTIRIHSPDTDVLVLVLRRYPDLCDDTSFVTGIGQKHRIIPLNPFTKN